MEDASTCLVLGGNQGDSVSLECVAKNRMFGARWPKAANAPEHVVTVAAGGALSTNKA